MSRYIWGLWRKGDCWRLDANGVFYDFDSLLDALKVAKELGADLELDSGRIVQIDMRDLVKVAEDLQRME